MRFLRYILIDDYFQTISIKQNKYKTNKKPINKRMNVIHVFTRKTYDKREEKTYLHKNLCFYLFCVVS